jgi:putative transposase
VHHRLYVACRERAGKEASPTAAILDSKSAKAGGKGVRGSTRSVSTRASKKVRGVEYHVLVDTPGLLLNAVAHAAGVQDRDGAALVLDHRTRALLPSVLAIFADAGYRGPRAASAARCSGRWRLRIVRRAAAVRGFAVLCRSAGSWSGRWRG